MSTVFSNIKFLADQEQNTFWLNKITEFVTEQKGWCYELVEGDTYLFVVRNPKYETELFAAAFEFNCCNKDNSQKELDLIFQCSFRENQDPLEQCVEHIWWGTEDGYIYIADCEHLAGLLLLLNAIVSSGPGEIVNLDNGSSFTNTIPRS